MYRGLNAECCDATVTKVNTGMATGGGYASVMSYSAISLPAVLIKLV
jgi:hypothetical protein